MQLRTLVQCKTFHIFQELTSCERGRGGTNNHLGHLSGFYHYYCKDILKGFGTFCLKQLNPYSGQFFKTIEKTQAISLYRFAEQQQTSTSRRQKFHLPNPKFSAEFNELSLKF